MKIKQHNRAYFMKGVSDTIYLAFVGVLSIGGTAYIYNDINTNKATVEISSDNKGEQTAKTVHQEAKIIDVKVEEKAVAVKMQIPAEQRPVVGTAVVKTETIKEKQQEINTETVVKTEIKPETQQNITKSITIKKDIVEAKTVENSASTASTNEQAVPDTAQKNPTVETTAKTEVPAQHSESTPQIAVTNKTTNMNPMAMYNNRAMPVPDMHGFVPAEYDHQMHQTARRMSQPYYMQTPYYNDNRNYQPVFEQQRADQQYEQQQYQQQRRQYQNTNSPYPEQYTPWNPGRFY